MTLIAGLGNIGNTYHGTRHNAGFEVADALAEKLGISFGEGRGEYLEASGAFRGHAFVIIKPTTYMNRSGTAVGKALAVHRESAENCLVCYDDIHLPLGTLKFRTDGSAGGHNGVQDIIDRLVTRAFPRLRLGVGNDFPKGRQVDYVLSPFREDERISVDLAIEKAVDGILLFMHKGIRFAMNDFNKKNQTANTNK